VVKGIVIVAVRFIAQLPIRKWNEISIGIAKLVSRQKHHPKLCKQDILFNQLPFNQYFYA